MKITNSTRLNYQLMDEKDAALLFELDQDPDVMKYINGGNPTSMDDIVNIFVPRVLSFTNKERGWGLWKITRNEDQQFLGWVLVRPMDFFTEQRDDTDLELGWRFNKAAWGAGYATEAAKHIAAHLKQNPHTLAFSASALEGNSGSINIMKKLGMRYIKHFTHTDARGDHNAVLYSMTL